jgi:hypothetical protein
MSPISRTPRRTSHNSSRHAWAQFAQDQKTIYAVVRAFEIIGEAVRQSYPLTQATREGPVEADDWDAGQSSSMSISGEVSGVVENRPRKYSSRTTVVGQALTSALMTPLGKLTNFFHT